MCLPVGQDGNDRSDVNSGTKEKYYILY